MTSLDTSITECTKSPTKKVVIGVPKYPLSTVSWVSFVVELYILDTTFMTSSPITNKSLGKLENEPSIINSPKGVMPFIEVNMLLLFKKVLLITNWD